MFSFNSLCLNSVGHPLKRLLTKSQRCRDMIFLVRVCFLIKGILEISVIIYVYCSVNNILCLYMYNWHNLRTKLKLIIKIKFFNVNNINK